MRQISEVLVGARTVGIAGHVRPDGDCVGSCMGLYLYLRKYYPELEVDVYLEEPSPVFAYIENICEIRTEPGEEKVYDLFITCDASSMDRIGVALPHFERARKTVCIDHHISNPGFAMINHVRGEIGSASEVLYSLLEPEKVDRSVATALYTGMIHDTGVFQYTSTTPDTMRIAGELMKTGFDFNKIIDESFYQKTYLQNQIMGRVLAESTMLLDGACIEGHMLKRDLDFYGVTGKELDGVVSQLRLTKGTEVAILMYEMEENVFKVSFRSNHEIDVSRIAVIFGGGGHAKAAGCTMTGTHHEILSRITAELEKQIRPGQAKGE